MAVLVQALQAGTRSLGNHRPPLPNCAFRERFQLPLFRKQAARSPPNSAQPTHTIAATAIHTTYYACYIQPAIQSRQYMASTRSLDTHASPPAHTTLATPPSTKQCHGDRTVDCDRPMTQHRQCRSLEIRDMRSVQKNQNPDIRRHPQPNPAIRLNDTDVHRSPNQKKQSVTLCTGGQRALRPAPARRGVHQHAWWRVAVHNQTR